MALNPPRSLSYQGSQGSIFGPILFVLFINDLHQGISTDTRIALYADDTTIWRSIKNEEDMAQLQRDINILYLWSLNNKMKFHPDKCKVVTIKHGPSPLAMLPFVAYNYRLAETLLSYADSEKDLGVHVNKSFNFNEHRENMLTKANSSPVWRPCSSTLMNKFVFQKNA